MSSSTKPSAKANPTSKSAELAKTAPDPYEPLNGLDWLIRPLPGGWPTQLSIVKNPSAAVSYSKLSSTHHIRWTPRTIDLERQRDFQEFLHAMEAFKMPVETHPPKLHAIVNEAQASMHFSNLMLDPVIRLMNAMLEHAKKDNFSFNATPEFAYSADKEQPAGRLDYRVWLCSNHDKVEESIKAASSQVKDSASGIQKSLKGLSIQEVPEDETNDWMAHTAGPSSSSTDTAKASTGRTGSSKKPAGKEGEAPESAEAPTIVGAIEGDDAPSALRVEDCFQALRDTPKQSRPLDKTALKVLSQITSYSKRLDYRHAFVSTFCGTFGVDFTDEGGPRGSGILHFDFFLCEGYSRIGDPRVAMAYRAWQLAKRVNAL